MHKPKYDTAVYIGRFQPFHLGHLHAIEEAAKLANNIVVLLGDTGGPRTIKNPFTDLQRQNMILDAIEADENLKYLIDGDWIQFKTIYDKEIDQDWIAQVREAVDQDEDETVCIVGHKKDKTSEYLNWFPNWKFEEIPYRDLGFDHKLALDATAIRAMWFEHRLHYARGLLPPAVWETLAFSSNEPEFEGLFEDYAYCKKYKEAWASAPFPPTFITVDPVVIQSGHVLLVRRGGHPGKGLLALPGGFINIDERLEDACIRELQEETSIDLQADTLKRCIKATRVFDDPNRSFRGRTVTHAFLIKLNDSAKLAKVKAGDDAVEVFWVPFEDLDPKELFDDHYNIIQRMKSLA